MLVISICVILFLLGGVLCLAGARLERLWFGAVGLITGILSGYRLGIRFFGQDAYGLIFALVLGILFMISFAALSSVGITLSSAFLVGTIVAFLLRCFGLAGLWWVIMMGAAVGAILGSMFGRTMTIIGSSLQGGYLMVLSVLAILLTVSGRDIESFEGDPMTALLILTIAFALGLIGAVFQSRNLRTRRRYQMEPVIRRDKRGQIYSNRRLQNPTETLSIKKFYLN